MSASNLAQVEGEFFAPRSSQSRPAVLALRMDGGVAVFDKASGEALAWRPQLEGLRGASAHFVCGSSFCAAAPFPPALLRALQTPTQRAIANFEKFSPRKAFFLILAFLALLVAARQGLEIAANVIADNFPTKWEKRLGESVYEAVAEFAFEKTAAPAALRERLQERATDMAAGAGLQSRASVIFHNSPRFGANAFAFPGGPIVVTDDLLKALDHDEELILAVIAHEYAHIERRHGLRQVTRALGLAALAYVIVGGYEGMAEEAAAAGLDLWNLRNSRRQEAEADLLMAGILLDNNMPAQNGWRALQKLSESLCEKNADACKETEDGNKETDVGNIFSTHPGMRERIETLKQKAGEPRP